MNVELAEIESRVLGRNVLVIHEVDAGADFSVFEGSYIETYCPGYVSASVALENVAAIHRIEDHGFRLVECQLKMVLKLSQPYDTTAYRYQLERVTSQPALDEVLQLAATSFEHDRFAMDPAIPRGVSGERYRLYTLKSYQDPAESVYRLIDPDSGETLAFKTCRYISGSEVRLFLSGVHPAMKGLGLGPISNYYYFNELLRLGVRKAHGYISAHNYAACNMDLGLMGFRIVGSFAVFRKLYEESGLPKRAGRDIGHDIATDDA